MQREKLTIKSEHSHLEIAKANRAKWLGHTEKKIAIKLQGRKKENGTRFPFTHTHTHKQQQQKKKWICTHKNENKVHQCTN